jgi:hypothetical protein
LLLLVLFVLLVSLRLKLLADVNIILGDIMESNAVTVKSPAKGDIGISEDVQCANEDADDEDDDASGNI